MLDSALKQSHDEVGVSALEHAVEESDTLLRMLDTALLISRAEAGIGRIIGGEMLRSAVTLVREGVECDLVIADPPTAGGMPPMVPVPTPDA